MRRWRSLFGYTVGFGALGVAAGVGVGWISVLSYLLAAAMGVLIAQYADRPGPETRRAIGTGLIGITLGAFLSLLVVAGVLAGVNEIPVDIAVWRTSLQLAIPWFGLGAVAISGYFGTAISSALR
jgi:hypothetical protein